MNILESEGLEIELSNGSKHHVFFIPLLILGDNLGLNSLLGYSKSFNSHFCRFCKIDKKKSSERLPTANPDMRRNYINYESDLALGNPEVNVHSIPSPVFMS